LRTFRIDHKPEVATVVWRLFAPLVTQINERHILVFPAKLEREYPGVERQCFLDIAHFERNVIETHRLFRSWQSGRTASGAACQIRTRQGVASPTACLA
jgi:hypothetical protein